MRTDRSTRTGTGNTTKNQGASPPACRWRITIAWLTALAAFSLVSSASAATQVSGTIIGGNWTPSGSPYIVVGDILVATLTIQPGATVYFQTNHNFEVDGVLTAVGTSANPIIFYGTNGGWQGLFFNFNNPGCEMGYCVVSNAVNSGIRITGTSPPFIHDSVISGNTSPGNGGGISVSGIEGGVSLVVSNCVISGNSATSSGGGVCALMGTNTIALNSCTVSGNTANSPGNNGTFGGGGIYVSGNSLVRNCTVSGNTCNASSGYGQTQSAQGGGLYTDTGSSQVHNSIFMANLAQCWSTDQYTTMRAYGGGICAWSGTFWASNAICGSNTTSAANTSTGGGIYINSGVTGAAVNCTFAYNNTEGLASGNPSVPVMNTILFFNYGGGTQISGPTNVTYCDVQNGVSGTGNINFNPIFLSTTNLMIVPGSRCIDAGNPSPAYNDVCFAPSLGTALNDIGAHGGPGACGWIGAPTCDIVVVAPPTNLVVGKSDSATFCVLATGSGQLGYQWMLDNTPIAGATGSCYTIPSAQSADAGTYAAIISNTLCSVTSPEAILTVSPEPPGWTNNPVNPPTLPGTVGYTNGVWTVTGSGKDIAGTGDAFEFVDRTLVGDGQIVARVTSLVGADPGAEAGLMIRESLGAGSTHAFLRIDATTNVVFRRRLATDAYSIDTVSSTKNHNWLRLMRMGNTFVAHCSTNGVNWEYVWFTTVNMSNQVQVGLAVTAHYQDHYATGIFDNVSVGSVSPLGTWPLPQPKIYMGGERGGMTEFQRVGGLKFLVGGVVGDQFGIKCSSNAAASLASWYSLGTVTNTCGVATFLDSQALTNRLRFYRVQRTGP